MKTIQELEEEETRNQKKDAEDLISRMFSFIPVEGKNSLSALISAKYCAKVACDYLIDFLPSINDTPPNSRGNENTYSQYWRGVKSELENYELD